METKNEESYVFRLKRRRDDDPILSLILDQEKGEQSKQLEQLAVSKKPRTDTLEEVLEQISAMRLEDKVRLQNGKALVLQLITTAPYMPEKSLKAKNVALSEDARSQRRKEELERSRLRYIIGEEHSHLVDLRLSQKDGKLTVRGDSALSPQHSEDEAGEAEMDEDFYRVQYQDVDELDEDEYKIVTYELDEKYLKVDNRGDFIGLSDGQKQYSDSHDSDDSTPAN